MWLSVTTLMLGNTLRGVQQESHCCVLPWAHHCTGKDGGQEYKMKHAIFLRASLSSNIVALLAVFYSPERV